MKEPWRTMSDDEYYKAMAAKYDYPDSERLPLIFKKVISPRECQEILYMPAQVEDLMKKMNLDRETVEKDIKHLYEGGVCNPGRSGWRLLPAYGAFKNAIGPSWKFDWEREGLCGKGSLMSEFHVKEMFPRNLAEQRLREEVEEASGGPGGSRAIAYWKAIDGIPGVEWYDDMREILKRADKEEDGIAVGRCACRWIHGVLDVPLWGCFNFSRYARYNLDRGAFKRLSYEEAIKVLDETMEAGLVHKQTPNCKAVERQICNCSWDGCDPWWAMAIYHEPMTHKRMMPSRFAPVVDLEKCKGCGSVSRNVSSGLT